MAFKERHRCSSTVAQDPMRRWRTSQFTKVLGNTKGRGAVLEDNNGIILTVNESDNVGEG